MINYIYYHYANEWIYEQPVCVRVIRWDFSLLQLILIDDRLDGLTVILQPTSNTTHHACSHRTDIWVSHGSQSAVHERSSNASEQDETEIIINKLIFFFFLLLNKHLYWLVLVWRARNERWTARDTNIINDPKHLINIGLYTPIIRKQKNNFSLW